MRLKLIIPVVVIITLGAGTWLFLESSGQTDEAGKAANAAMNAADRAIDAAIQAQRYRAEEEPNYVNVGAIFTNHGNVSATLVVKGTNGVDAVYNRIAHVRDYLVVLLSDHPPEPRNLAAGPSDYDGSVRDGISSLLDDTAVQSVRFDPFSLGQTGGSASC